MLPLSITASLTSSSILEVNPLVSKYQLPEFPIMAHSELVLADTLLLNRGIDYQIDYKTGLISFMKLPKAQSVVIECYLVPEQLRDPIYRFLIVQDSVSAKVKRPPRQWLPDDGKLIIRGSKTFALTFSDNEDFELKQSLFVNLSGELADNVMIQAQLSDSESKLSPEGDSKELSSLDQVFIRVYGREYEFALGDLELEFRDTHFMNYKTKFEGLNAFYDKRHKIQTAYAANSGKRASAQIQIIEGKQGPYYLKAGDYQQNFIVIAGSEAVYLDGTLMERGADYYIDYADGSLMFKRLVSSSNQILAYFQYSDEYYKQNSFLNSSYVAITDRIGIKHHFINQADDKRSPMQYSFSAADLDSLKLAGDNTVYGEGVFESSSGSYFQRETPAGTIYYEYAEGDTTATYNVVFSYVGYGMGDYEEYSTGKYRFVGSGLGSWLPQKRLMPPATRMNLNTILSYDAEVLSLGIEGLYGYQDKNTLSSLDDNDNKSLLLYAYARYKPDWDILKPSVKADYEEKSANSYLFAETSEPEADHSGLDTEASSAEKAQMQSNLSLDLNYGGVFVPGISYRLKRIYGLFEQNSLRSNYALQMALFDVKGSDFVMNLNGSHTLGKQVYYDSRQSRLQYHNLLSSWQYRIFTISADGLYNSVQYSNWQVQALSTRYQKLSPGIALSFKQGFSSKLTYTYDQNDKAETDTSPWIKYSSSNTYNLRQNISTPNHTLELDASHRQVKYFDSSTSNTSYELVTLRSNHNFLKRAVSLNTNYQLNQNEFFPKIREFQYVGSGQGAYDADSTYVGTGDYDYVYLSGEVGQLSAEINGQLNLYIRPGYLTQNSTLRRFQTDLSFQATEQSSLRNDYGLYLFLPGSVYSQDHTIYGRQAYLQNLWIDLLANRLTGQLQYEVIRSLDQRYSDPYSPNALIYRSFNQNRAIEFNLRSAFNYRLRGQFDSEEDSRYDSDIENYALSLLIQRYLSPQTSVEISLEGSREEGNDRSQTTGYQMDSYAIKPALRSVWMQKYRLTASFSFRYNDRQGSEYLTFLRDKRQGFISLWNLAVIYKMNSFSTFSLEYSGDSYPEQKTAHQLRLEFKAEL